jgi:hypothetical protein
MRAPVWVDEDVRDRLKEVAARKRVTMGEFVARKVAAEERYAGGEPLSREDVAALVCVISRTTGETHEACLNRIVSRGVLEELGVVCV